MSDAPPITLVKVGKRQNMVQLGNDRQNAKWYFLAPAVQTFLKNSNSIKAGSKVNFVLNGDVDEQSGLKVISKLLGRGGGASSFNGNYQKSGSSTYGKRDSATITDIRRQVALKAAVETVKVLQGQVDRNDVMDVVRSFHEAYVQWLDGNTKATVNVEGSTDDEPTSTSEPEPGDTADEGAVTE